MGTGAEYTEPAEDHQRNDEAPEDHCRDQEPDSASGTHARTSTHS